MIFLSLLATQLGSNSANTAYTASTGSAQVSSSLLQAAADTTINSSKAIRIHTNLIAALTTSANRKSTSLSSIFHNTTASLTDTAIATRATVSSTDSITSVSNTTELVLLPNMVSSLMEAGVDHSSKHRLALLVLLAIFSCISLAICVAVLVFCRKKNTVFMLQQCDQDSDLELELDDMKAEVDTSDSDCDTQHLPAKSGVHQTKGKAGTRSETYPCLSRYVQQKACQSMRTDCHGSPDVTRPLLQHSQTSPGSRRRPQQALLHSQRHSDSELLASTYPPQYTCCTRAAQPGYQSAFTRPAAHVTPHRSDNTAHQAAYNPIEPHQQPDGISSDHQLYVHTPQNCSNKFSEPEHCYQTQGSPVSELSNCSTGITQNKNQLYKRSKSVENCPTSKGHYCEHVSWSGSGVSAPGTPSFSAVCRHWPTNTESHSGAMLTLDCPSCLAQDLSNS